MSFLADCFHRLTETRTQLRGYKVTDANRTRKFGVACRNFQELKRKACAKLDVTNDPTEVSVFLVDGSLIDEEYFDTLEPQTTLILLKPGEKLLSDADMLYDVLRRVNIDYLAAGERVSQFLTENLKAKVALLNKVLNKDDSKTIYSSRSDHPDWFVGLETNIATKEAYMHRRCQDRIRGYLYKAIEQIKTSEVFKRDQCARRQLLQAIAYFKLQLREDHYFGHYFDRSCSLGAALPKDVVDFSSCYEHCPCRTKDPCLTRDEIDARKFATSCAPDDRSNHQSAKDEPVQCPYDVRPADSREHRRALCDASGEFRCEGVWYADVCSYGKRHRINPYRSREELVLFSTWNLDHKIERSRTIVPKLLEISERGAVEEQDVRDCYENLFTLKNMKLVHIVCHDKGMHKQI